MPLRLRFTPLYRVADVEYAYSTADKQDRDSTGQAPDWRDEEARHRGADPMASTAAPMVSARPAARVTWLGYSHDWLANMSEWRDDGSAFYERSLGDLLNGADISHSTANPTHRPSALYFACNIQAHPGSQVIPDLGGWLEADYGAGGNLLGLTVHGRCTDSNVSARSCTVPSTSDNEAKRAAMRAGCTCAVEQHYVYRWDELNRLHEARRYDRAGAGAWQIAARQRYRYDGSNQRVIKQTFEAGSSAFTTSHRAALYIYGGDVERRGLEAGTDRWNAIPGETETQYLIADRDQAMSL